ncbi:hypothetical protein RFI_05725, partial [Reticulomyxa filosa]
MLAFLFWIGITLANYYIIGGDLPDIPLIKVTSVAEYSIQAILGKQSWSSIDSTNIFSPLRSVMVQGWVVVTAIFSTLMLLNLLIATLSAAFKEVREMAQLEVNFTRVKQSVLVSSEVLSISFRNNKVKQQSISTFVFETVCDVTTFLHTIERANSKYTKKIYFSPLNRKVFRAGDRVTFQELAYKNGEPVVENKEAYVHGLSCNEIAMIKVTNDLVEIRKQNIKKVHKTILTERSRTDQTSCFATNERFYCKYCRFQFLTSDVGSVDNVRRLFAIHGKLLDPDDLSQINNQTGGILPDYKPNKRKDGVAQLCPEVLFNEGTFFFFGIFSKQRSDECGRAQFLGEVSSFWVFMVVMWIPLILMLLIPAFFSILGGGSEEDKTSNQQQLSLVKEKGKISAVEGNDLYRKKVRAVFREETSQSQFVTQIRKRVELVRRRLQDEEATGPLTDDSIAFRAHRKNDRRRLKRLEDTHKEL